jgi:hydroxymethylbilane synthase
MGGSCSVPLAAHARWQGGSLLQLDAAWGDEELAMPVLRASLSADVKSIDQADALGLAVAQGLQAAGAKPRT